MIYKVSKEEQKRADEIAKYKVTCKCGCVSILPPNKDYYICRWCGRKVYRTPQLKFKYEMKERLNK